MSQRSARTRWVVVSGFAAAGLLLAGCSVAATQDAGRAEGRFVSFAAPAEGDVAGVDGAVGVAAQLPTEPDASGEDTVGTSTAAEPAPDEDARTSPDDAAGSEGGSTAGADATEGSDSGGADRSASEGDPQPASGDGGAESVPGASASGPDSGAPGTADQEGAAHDEAQAPAAVEPDGDSGAEAGRGSIASDGGGRASRALPAEPTVTVSPEEISQSDISDPSKGVTITVTGAEPGSQIYDQLSNEYYDIDEDGTARFVVVHYGDASKVTGEIDSAVVDGETLGDLFYVAYVFTVVEDGPTDTPTTDAPTGTPTTDAPTGTPTTDAPTATPTTDAPTETPTTTSAPTSAPTSTATDDAPTSTPSETPSGWSGTPSSTSSAAPSAPSTTSTDRADGATVHTGGSAASGAPVVVGGALIALGGGALVLLAIRRWRHR